MIWLVFGISYFLTQLQVLSFKISLVFNSVSVRSGLEINPTIDRVKSLISLSELGCKIIFKVVRI